jgi:hypothetical protein
MQALFVCVDCDQIVSQIVVEPTYRCQRLPQPFANQRLAGIEVATGSGGAIPAVACSRATTSSRRVAEDAELHGGPHEKEMDAFGIQSVEQAVRLLGRQGHHNLLRLIH